MLFGKWTSKVTITFFLKLDVESTSVYYIVISFFFFFKNTSCINSNDHFKEMVTML